MTQQYLCGELSVRLAMLQDDIIPMPSAELAQLRHQAESVPPTALTSIVARALRLCGQSCWEALDAGDVVAFEHLAARSAELLEFAVCARLFDED